MVLTPWTSDVLRKQGYDIACRLDSTETENFNIFLSKGDRTLNLEFERKPRSDLAGMGVMFHVTLRSFSAGIASVSDPQHDSQPSRPTHWVQWEDQRGFPDLELGDDLGDDVTLQLGLDAMPGSDTAFHLRIEVIHHR